MYCLSKVLTKIRSPEDQKNRQEILLGFAASIFSGNDDNITVRHFAEKIWPKIRSWECDIYFDQMLRPIGFVSWITRIDSKSARPAVNGRASHKTRPRLPNASLLIVDFLFKQGDICSMLKGVRTHLLSRDRPVCYVRQKAGRYREARIVSAPGLRVTTTHVDGATTPELWTVRNDILEKCEDQLSKLISFGQALSVLNLSPLYQDVPLRTAVSMITTASGMGQMKVYKNAVGASVGLLTWAWFSKWTMARLTADAQTPIHPCEWNEGEMLCFRDIAVTPNSALQIAGDLAGGLFPEESSCLLMVRDRNSKDVVLFSIPDSKRGSLSTWMMAQFKIAGSKPVPAQRRDILLAARPK